MDKYETLHLNMDVFMWISNLDFSLFLVMIIFMTTWYLNGKHETWFIYSDVRVPRFLIMYYYQETWMSCYNSFHVQLA